jgi:hypothetical protein
MTKASVIFQALSGELNVAEFAESSAQCASESEMIGHHNARYLSVAKVRAW